MRAERKQGGKEALGCWPLPVGVAACYIAFMNSSEALKTLRCSEQALRGRGVKHAALFGSVARGDNRSDSDIDIMIEIDPGARITVFDYVGLKEYIAALFDEPVDVVNRESLKPCVRPAATAGAIYAFRAYGRRTP
jgi:predicted nucleotidyltransferase